MPIGTWTPFRKSVEKISKGVIDLSSHDFKLVLCNSSQVLTSSFVGTSTDARYSDLTGELATGNGYVSGGVSLTSPEIATVANVSTWQTDDGLITLTGSLTFKYGLIYDNTTTNKDLICFVDMDTDGGNASATISPLVFIMSNGIFRFVGV